MITDEKLVDALDDWRQNADPRVLQWVVDMAKGAVRNKTKHPPEFVAGFEALARLAVVVAGKEKAA